jgi:acyl-CoA dehydrogenase
MFLPGKKSEPLAQLEYALQKSVDSAPLVKRLREAIHAGVITASWETAQLKQAVEKGVLNQHEASQLKQAWQARDKAIAVDDFSHDYWSKEHRHGNESAA